MESASATKFGDALKNLNFEARFQKLVITMTLAGQEKLGGKRRLGSPLTIPHHAPDGSGGSFPYTVKRGQG